MDGTECQTVGPVLEHQRRNAQTGDAGIDVLVDTRIEQDDLSQFLPAGHPADDHPCQGVRRLAAGHRRCQPRALGGDVHPLAGRRSGARSCRRGAGNLVDELVGDRGLCDQGHHRTRGEPAEPPRPAPWIAILSVPFVHGDLGCQRIRSRARRTKLAMMPVRGSSPAIAFNQPVCGRAGRGTERSGGQTSSWSRMDAADMVPGRPLDATLRARVWISWLAGVGTSCSRPRRTISPLR